MRCHACGAEARAGATICSECGARLRPWRPVWRHCEHCGHTARGNESVCPACGQALVQRAMWPRLLAGLGAVTIVVLTLFARGLYGQALSEYFRALPTALYEISRAELATVTLAPLGPTVTPPVLATVTPSVTPTPAATNSPIPSPTVPLAETTTPTPSGVQDAADGAG